jgi:putative phosphoesterase
VILGILSDTHGRLESTKAAVRALQDAGAQFFIHCGDVGSEPVLDQLAGLRAAIVWGNNDWDTRSLGTYAQALGIAVLPALGEIELDQKRIAVTHGDNPGLIRKVLDEQQHDYLLLGHSHVRADKKMGRVRVINPGALHRAAQKSVAVLDLESDRLQFLMI